MSSGEFEEVPPPVMAYFQAIRFVADSPGWLMNLVWGSLCFASAMVIPVAGQIVWMGYGVEVLESLLRGNAHRYPDFDVNRLVEYLQRGAWPFLALLIVAVVMVPIGVIVVGLYALVILLSADAGQQWLVAVLAILSIPLIVLLVAALHFFSTPIILRGADPRFFGRLQFGFCSRLLSTRRERGCTDHGVLSVLPALRITAWRIAVLYRFLYRNGRDRLDLLSLALAALSDIPIARRGSHPVGERRYGGPTCGFITGEIGVRSEWHCRIK